MILSEFTGAAQSLNGALIVNPWNTEELADAIHEAVTMGSEQRTLNFQKMHKYVKKYTSAWWGKTFVAELRRISEQAERKAKGRQGSLDLLSKDWDAGRNFDGQPRVAQWVQEETDATNTPSNGSDGQTDSFVELNGAIEQDHGSD